jgi:carbonic anhydrase
MIRKDRTFWIVAALSAMVVTAAPNAWAQWKWKDSKGQTHISDLPPPRDIPDKDVLQRPSEIARKATVQSAAAASDAAPAA